MASTLKQVFEGKQHPSEPNMNAMFEEFKKNPMEYLTRARLNIPQNIGANPQAIVTHLMQTGQIPRQLLPQIQAMFRH